MTPEMLRILLVEDNPGDVRLLREMFSTERPNSYEITHLPRLGLALNHLAKGEWILFFSILAYPMEKAWIQCAGCASWRLRFR